MRDAGSRFLFGVAVAVPVLLVVEAFRLAPSLEVLTFPAVVGGIVGVCCLLVLIRDARRPSDTRPAAEVLAETWSASAWVMAGVALAHGVGYPAGLALFVLAYGLAHGLGPAVSSGLALAVLAAVGGGFVWLLGVPLPVLPVMLR